MPSRDLLSVPAPLWEELVTTADHPDKYSAIRPEREWLERAYERAVDDPDSVLLGDPGPLPGDSDWGAELPANPSLRLLHLVG